jgi:hypothetical protein
MKTIKTIPPEVAAVIPCGQLEVTKQNPNAYIDPVKRLEEQLKKCPNIGATDGLKKHPAIFHYFCGATDIYICEFDGEDTLFGFTILNGDIDNSEWGYSSLSEITAIPVMNIDYYFEKQSIEAALYLKYPEHFKKPASLEK